MTERSTDLNSNISLPEETAEVSAEGNLVFITYTGAPEQAARHPAIRHSVRRQATQAQRLSSSSASSSRPTGRTVASLRSSTSRFRLQNSQRQESREPSESRVRIPWLPYFEPLLNELGLHASHLLHYYMHFFRTDAMPADSKQHCFSFIIADAATVHATFSLVSLNRDLESHSPVSQITLRHRAKALDLIRTQLQDGQQNARSTIPATIALLVVAESLEGNAAHSAVHLEGLSTVVARSGGPEAFADNHILYNLISWADTTYSLTWSTAGRIRTQTERLSSNRAVSGASESGDSTGERAQQSLRDAFDERLRDIFLHLQSFPQQQQAALNSSASDRDRTIRMLYSIERAFVDYQALPPREDDKESFSTMLFHAIQLYVCTALRNVPLRAAMIQHLKNQLKQDIRSVREQYPPISDLSEGQTLIILWCSVIFLLLECDVGTTSDHVDLTMEIIRHVGIANLDDLVLSLRKITWKQNFLDDRMGAIIQLLHA